MRFLSLFSGIEAASSAWLPLGWTCAAVAEVDKSARRVLKAKYPEVPNLGDITKITQQDIEALGYIDIVVYGFPCQDLSIAGKHAGLKGKRSGLFFDAVRIIRWSRARFALFENVPGLFSSEHGRDFAAVVGALTGLECDVPEDGWRNTGVAAGPLGLLEWSVLDAQWFGVPQRRRRIFALSDFGDWASRSPILFDAESLSGDTPPCRETRQDVTGNLGARTSGGGGLGTDFDLGGGYELSPALTGSGRGTERAGCSRGQDCVIPVAGTLCASGSGMDRPSGQHNEADFLIASTGETSHCLNAGGMGRIDYETETLVTHATSIAFSSKDHGADAVDLSPTLRAMGHGDSHANAGGRVAVAFNLRGRDGGAMPEVDPDGQASMRAASGGGSRSYVAGPAVRRLTPLECTRLQGFEDDYFTGMKLADGPIYKMLGNSMAVPVMRWIGERIGDVA